MPAGACVIGDLPEHMSSLATGACAEISRLERTEVKLLRDGSEHLRCSNSVHRSVGCVLGHFQLHTKST